MFLRLLVFSFLSLASASALAQEYGFTLGVNQTTASTDTTNSTIEGQLNYRFGLAMNFELVPAVRFRTGAVYSTRKVEQKFTGITDKYAINYGYVDVPATVQYNFNDMVGVFGGLVIGINVDDHVGVPATLPAYDRAKGLMALGTVGVNLLFDDMIGFDLYYERGMTKAADHLKDYSTFGGNFIYWF